MARPTVQVHLFLKICVAVWLFLIAFSRQLSWRLYIKGTGVCTAENRTTGGERNKRIAYTCVLHLQLVMQLSSFRSVIAYNIRGLEL